jgi:hypothetical protein
MDNCAGGGRNCHSSVLGSAIARGHTVWLIVIQSNRFRKQMRKMPREAPTNIAVRCLGHIQTTIGQSVRRIAAPLKTTQRIKFFTAFDAGNRHDQSDAVTNSRRPSRHRMALRQLFDAQNPAQTR